MDKLERLLLRPTEAGEVLGISRSKIYELLASGEIPSVRVGNPRTRRIPLAALRQWIEKKRQAGEGEGPR
jgi:excisionase family DNA binding protein